MTIYDEIIFYLFFNGPTNPSLLTKIGDSYKIGRAVAQMAIQGFLKFDPEGRIEIV